MKNSFISSFENNRKYRVKAIYVILFASLFVSSFVLIEILNRSFVQKWSKDFQALEHFNEQKKSVKLLFIGDSQFQCGIDLTFFNRNAFNLSFAGANLIQSYYILKHHIEKMESLEFVVIPLSLHTFSSFRTDRVTNPVFWNRFIDYSELREIKGFGILRNKFAITVLEETTGRKSLLSNLAKLILRNSPLTSEPSGYRQFVDADKAIRRAKFHLHNRRVLDKDLLIYFGKMLKLWLARRTAGIAYAAMGSTSRSCQ